MPHAPLLNLLTLAVLSITAFTTPASADYRSNVSNTCLNTATTMKSACRADTVDNYFENIARCLNNEDTQGCKVEARQTYREDRHECADEFTARNVLCERLPDTGPYIADLDPENFTGACVAGNTYFPLVPGTVTTFVNPTEEEPETIIVTVTADTREIDGIEAMFVNDRVFEGWPDADGNLDEDAEPIEDTDDYYAVADNCDVYYLGEVAQNFEDGYLTDLDGSFIAGEDGAQAGIIMLADPGSNLGRVYRQEFALGDAEDAAEIISVSADIDLNDSPFPNVPVTCNGACLQTDDFVGTELDSGEFKYYVPGIGVIAETDLEGEVVLKLIKIETVDLD